MSSSSAEGVPTQQPGLAGRSPADCVGFCFFVLLAVSLVARADALSILVLPPVIHELLIATTFLLRGEPRGRLPGLAPRLAAYGGTLLIPTFVLVARVVEPGWLAADGPVLLRPLGAVAWSAGLLLGLWPIWMLRRSFSVEPVARTLVTEGPYRFARHPIYASYVLVYGGMLVLAPSLALATCLLAWAACIALRIRFEERVLTAAFPEYRQYRARVPALGIRLPLARRFASAPAQG